MLTAATAQDIADAYDLGGSATLTGPVARGQLGQVWRLDTEAGTHAVKEWFATPDLAAMSRDADLVAAALAEGVVTPRIVHTTTGAVATTVADTAVRMFEWVDLRGPMRGLDPTAVGATLAALHRAGPPTDEPVDNWFATGLGEQRWRELHQRVVDEQAPFAGHLGALVDELVAVESVIEPHESPIVCHRDLWADNVLATADGRVCVVDFENLGPADPSQELAMVLFEFGDDDPSRARLHPHGIPRRRRPGAGDAARPLHHARGRAGPHRSAGVLPLGRGEQRVRARAAGPVVPRDPRRPGDAAAHRPGARRRHLTSGAPVTSRRAPRR